MTLLVLGVLVSFALWILQRRRIGPKAKAVLAIAFTSGFIAIVAILKEGQFLGQASWYDRTPYREMCFLALMLMGMAVRYLAGLIEERRERMRELAKSGQKDIRIGLRFDIWEFSYPLLFSVVTFGGLLGQLKEGNLSTANAILSFQNGFFWQTLLKKSVQSE